MLYASITNGGITKRGFFATYDDFHRATFSPDIDINYVKEYASKAALERWGFCVNHTGKMRGILSISTSVKLNTRCAARAHDENSICHYCYANKMANLYSALERKLARNTEKLTGSILDEKDIPLINPDVFPLVRFESFGDLMNTTQCVNYFRIAASNPQCNFALWTKNPDIVSEAAELVEKPENLIVIVSSPKVNKEIEIPAIADKVFTVYNNDHEINCGARSCATCQKCYHKNGINHLYEKIK